MEHENLDIGSIVGERRRAVEESIQLISREEITTLQQSLFADPLHPWAEPFQRFLEEHRGSLFYHGVTYDQVQVIYCREQEKGIWFTPGVGMGILQPKALEQLREIVDARLG
jgi:hypothetical protein